MHTQHQQIRTYTLTLDKSINLTTNRDVMALPAPTFAGDTQAITLTLIVGRASADVYRNVDPQPNKPSATGPHIECKGLDG